MSRAAKELILALSHDLSEEDNAAFDLWSWLPTRDVAVKHHGDYADAHRPSNADVIREAAEFIGAWRDADLGTSWRDLVNRLSATLQCPCGEEHS